VVPKVLWQKKYPADSENYIPLDNSPVLVKSRDGLILIDSGLGNKLTEKQKKIFRVRKDWTLLDDLRALGIAREDIGMVILTHYDFDHAGGVLMQNDAGGIELTFPRARHILQRAEWDDVLNPNSRTISTYWPVNNELMRGNKALELVNGTLEVAAGISVHLTAGHNMGHQIIRMTSRGEAALHLGDLLPTHAHSNPLWVMAYDNFPMDAIRLKEEWLKTGIAEKAWFTFYHDAFLNACRFDDKGNVTEKWTEG